MITFAKLFHRTNLSVQQLVIATHSSRHTQTHTQHVLKGHFTHFVSCLFILTSYFLMFFFLSVFNKYYIFRIHFNLLTIFIRFIAAKAQQYILCSSRTHIFFLCFINFSHFVFLSFRSLFSFDFISFCAKLVSQ